MRSDKKTAELVTIRYFLEKLDDAPRGKLLSGESPDFILRLNKKQQIGIELTSIPIGYSPDYALIAKEITTIVKKKEEKLSRYRRKKLNKIWLVITIDDLGYSQKDSFAQFLGRMDLDSGFDRLFLFDLFGGKVLELGL
jgi:hypothetical protein